MVKVKKNKKVKSSTLYLPIYLLVIFIILLSVINIKGYFYPAKPTVLGIETSIPKEIFWYEFLKENPSYIPGWIEVGRSDKVDLIDPNWESGMSD